MCFPPTESQFMSASCRYFFILGCERSGSTWVSNVISAHPEIEFFMEPFADYADIFPGFPSRNLHIEEAGESLVNLVRDGYKKLPDLKAAFTYKRGSSPYWKVIDRYWLGGLRNLCRLARLRLPIRAEQFHLLNLNASEIPVSIQSRLSNTYKHIVTKELRLNFKIGLLKQAFPAFKCLIVMRHPGSQINSIMRLRQGGRLGELSRALLTFYEHVKNSERFRNYLFLLENWDGKSEEEKLVAWWIINYDVLIQDCKKLHIDYRILRHEDLSAHPLNGFRKVFEFMGVDCPKSVENYICYSTAAENHNIASPLDTRRNSINYSKETLSGISAEQRVLISQFLMREEISDELKVYCE